jgi:hypothetical protein
MYSPEQTRDTISILRAKKTCLKTSMDYVDWILNTAFHGSFIYAFQ